MKWGIYPPITIRGESIKAVRYLELVAEAHGEIVKDACGRQDCHRPYRVIDNWSTA